MKIRVMLPLFVSFFCLAPVQAQTTVVPGHSVGRVFLGMDRADVWKILGKPLYKRTFVSSALPAPHPSGKYTLDTWAGLYRPYGVGVLCCNAVVVQVEVSSPKFRASDGASTATPFAVIREHFPRLQVTEYEREVDRHGALGATVEYADDIHQGIAFKISTDTDVMLSAHLSQLKPEELVVHLPRWPVLPVETDTDSFLTSDASDPMNQFADIRAWFAGKPQAHKGN